MVTLVGKNNVKVRILCLDPSPCSLPVALFLLVSGGCGTLLSMGEVSGAFLFLRGSGNDLRLECFSCKYQM